MRLTQTALLKDSRLAKLMALFNRSKSTENTTSSPEDPSSSNAADQATEEASLSFPINLYNNLNQLFYSQVFNTAINKDLLANEKKLELDQIAKQLLQNADYRAKATPRMPAVLPQLMKCLKDENASNKQFVELIKQDPSIAASVLKSANSVLYNPSGRKVDSFDRAVVILGNGGLKSIVCTAMLQPLSKQSQGNKEFSHQLWIHSLRTGISAQLLAKQYKLEPFNLYLAGLFHCIGELTAYTQVFQWQPANLREEANSFIYLKKQCAEKVSLQILEQWELPEEIQTTLQAQFSEQENGVLYKSIAISFACYLSEQEKINEEQLEQIFEALNINASFIEQVNVLTADTLSAQS